MLGFIILLDLNFTYAAAPAGQLLRAGPVKVRQHTCVEGYIATSVRTSRGAMGATFEAGPCGNMCAIKV